MKNSTIYCTSCGASNPTGSSFCYKCGKPMQVNMPSQANLDPSEYATIGQIPPPRMSVSKKQAVSRNAIIIISLVGIIIVGSVIALAAVLFNHTRQAPPISLYPQLAMSYSGSFDNRNNFSLFSVTQDQMGNITVRYHQLGTGEIATVTGKVTHGNHIRLGTGTFTMDGTIFPDGHITGTYTDTHYAEHGTWTVSPVRPQHTPSGYPQLLSSYNGIYTIGSESSLMALESIIEDQQGTIHGEVSLHPNTGDATFTPLNGSVTRDNHISFSTFTDTTVNFIGTFLPDGHLEGTWNSSNGSGTWILAFA